MAHLLSPVCTDLLKFQIPVQSSRYTPWRFPAKIGGVSPWCLSSFSGKRRRGGMVRVATEDPTSLSADDVADDYYAVLGLGVSAEDLNVKRSFDGDHQQVLTRRNAVVVHYVGNLPDATQEEIKKAYYNCMKACHPDLSGNDPETTNFCMFINEVYAVLSDPVQRMVYDEIHGYTVTAINPFLDDSTEKDHIFVDEFACIGCKNCANVAPDIFQIEEDYGRARAYNQCGNWDLVQQAVETCPVDCIHRTSAAQLSLLEDEMRRVERVNVALMLSGMGSGAVDVFRMASSRWEKRQAKVLGQARSRMMKRKGPEETPSYWDNLWGKPKDLDKSEEEVKERAKRAAAAARRWREYSRRGVDKRPTFKLPEASSEMGE